MAKEGSCWWTFGPANTDVFYDGNLGVDWPDRDPVDEYLRDPQAKLAPTAEAAAIADQFVQATGLLPEGGQRVGVSPMTAVHGLEVGTGQEKTAVLTSSVVYRRFHDGFPEGSLGAAVNGKGEVVRVNKNMRDVKSLGRFPLLRPDEARKMIRSPSTRMAVSSNAPNSAPVRAVIEKVTMEYYDGATMWRYDTIQPVYTPEGTGWDTKGRSHQFTAQVPAVRPEYLEPAELPVSEGATASAAHVAAVGRAQH